MASPNTAKPATALHGEPASNSEQLGGPLGYLHTSQLAGLQLRCDIVGNYTALAAVIAAPYEAEQRRL